MSVKLSDFDLKSGEYKRLNDAQIEQLYIETGMNK